MSAFRTFIITYCILVCVGRGIRLRTSNQYGYNMTLIPTADLDTLTFSVLTCYDAYVSLENIPGNGTG